METKRILVTGVSGFLGRHISRHLETAGHEVVGFDRVEPSMPAKTFVRGDFTSREDLLRATKGVNAVCHLGGVGDVYLADRDPALAFQANAYGTIVVCEFCASSGIESLVYASTWEVYGKPLFQPVDESHPCNPETPYSISKLAGDLVARRYAAEKTLKVTVLRLGTAYGEHMRATAVISRFIERAKSGKSLVVLGDGSQFRQFTHAFDISRAFELATVKDHPSTVFNIVSSERTTVLELAKRVSARYRVGIDFQDSRKGDPPSAMVGSRLAERELGWTQKVRFQEGLDALLQNTEMNS